MVFDNRRVLLIIVAASLLLLPAIVFSSSLIRALLGIPFVLLFPGYCLMSALFPREDKVDKLERFVLSVGLSIVVVAFIGLALNFTPWGIRLYPILVAVTAFILIFAVMALWRERVVPKAERIRYSVRLRAEWRGMSRSEKMKSASLLLLLMAMVGLIGYTIASSQKTEQYTEFYILGPGGKAEGYPKQGVVGQPVWLVVGIENLEGVDVSYRVEVKIGVEVVGGLSVGPLESGQKVEEAVSFTPRVAGNNQKVQVSLFMNGSTEPYSGRPLSLYLDVR